VDEACEGCEDAITALDKTCAACAKVLSVWENVAAEEEPCCSKCSKCSKCCATEAKVAVSGDDAPVTDGQVAPASAVVAVDSSENAQELLRQKLAQRDQLQREIDELSAATESWQQIVVRVKVLEVNLTKMRKQGVDLASFGLRNNFQAFSGETTGDPSAYAQDTSGKHPQPPCGAGAACRKSVGTAWDALQDNNLARVIAAPTLVAVSGRPASFEVGGELPIPTREGSESVCQFISFGTKLDVLALALGGNKVRLEVRPKISEVCDDRSLVADENGNKIPSLRVTQCDTACELEFGETAALTGLVTRRIEATKTEKGVKEVAQDVMLLVIVTPEAVGTRVAQRVAEAK
jgi:pilus assembly protein CpaC